MMEVRVAAQRGAELKGTCSHHWVIDTPDGPTSSGRCKCCGARKKFNNYLPYSSWADEKAAKRKRARRREPEEDESRISV